MFVAAIKRFKREAWNNTFPECLLEGIYCFALILLYVDNLADLQYRLQVADKFTTTIIMTTSFYLLLKQFCLLLLLFKSNFNLLNPNLILNSKHAGFLGMPV